MNLQWIPLILRASQSLGATHQYHIESKHREVGLGLGVFASHYI